MSAPSRSGHEERGSDDGAQSAALRRHEALLELHQAGQADASALAQSAIGLAAQFARHGPEAIASQARGACSRSGGALGPAELCAALFAYGPLSPGQAAAWGRWAMESLDGARAIKALEGAFMTLAPRSALALPGIGSMAPGPERAWAKVQAGAPLDSALALYDLGLGLACVDDWAPLSRGARLHAQAHGGDSTARPLIEALLKTRRLDGKLGGVGKSSLFQTLMRKASDTAMVKLLVDALVRSGLPQGALYEGAHPLWVLAGLPWSPRTQDRDRKTLWASLSAMKAGFGPNMELPAGMRLALSPTQRKNSAPSFPLEWAKRRQWLLADLCSACAPYGLDLEARNTAGETILGALNRFARSESLTRGVRLGAESDFLAIHKLGADPLGIVPVQSSHRLAANQAMRERALASAERLALRAALDEPLVQRAKEIMEQTRSIPRTRAPRL